ncbi:copper chaperone PCu(A)C [Campylobacter upsaliensis]|uniref:copper chaperone PCu(A)C n=1 Tax=Campylobacter upsaliensis TaxID=28080 RepID=UPI0022EB45B8|nr:copper chaperone PCu(A)C [Campylobacter upsaliensis]
MLSKKIFILSLLGLSLSATEIEISNAYIKQTPPNSKNTAIFLTLTNKGAKEIALINAQSDLSDKIELHTHIHKDKKMSMIQIPKIAIEPNSTTELKPGSYHIMLFDLKNPINADTKANLTLYFDNNTSLKVEQIPSKKL